MKNKKTWHDSWAEGCDAKGEVSDAKDKDAFAKRTTHFLNESWEGLKDRNKYLVFNTWSIQSDVSPPLLNPFYLVPVLFRCVVQICSGPIRSPIRSAF